MRKTLILDTSILCTWLRVTGKETCGPDNNRWDYDRVSEKINAEIEAGTTLVLPLAAIIETGNHIAQCPGNRYALANNFAEFIRSAANADTPWAAFTHQSTLWSKDGLSQLADRWKDTAVSGQSLGDASIIDVAKFYTDAGYSVEILTGDAGLKSYEPTSMTPRRRAR
jgi:hypothetical protein